MQFGTVCGGIHDSIANFFPEQHNFIDLLGRPIHHSINFVSDRYPCIDVTPRSFL